MGTVAARRVAGVLAAFCLAPGPAGAAGEVGGYPQRPIRIVVGFTPGGGPDITARYVAQRLADAWKQAVVVDNRPGASGLIAAQTVAAASADGHTLLSVSSAHAVAPAIQAKLPFDVLRDFAGITQTATSHYLLVVPAAFPAKSVRELIAAGQARPGQLGFASAGVGSGTHFAAELFRSLARVDALHVPFKGIPEAVTETVSGRTQFFMAPIANALALVRDGRLIALGVSSAKRDPLLPEVPTIAEAGVAGYESVLWFGLLAPARTPRAIVARLNAEAARILDAPDVRARWSPIGLTPAPGAPEAFDRRIAEDVAVFTKIARAANIRAE